MADSEKSGNEIIHLSEETQSGLDDENHIRSQDSQPPPSAENQCVPHGYKFQDENRLVPKESQSGLQPYQQQPPMPFPVNLIEGNYNKPNFGPVRNTKYVEANKIENATVVHHHYNYYPEQRSSHGATIDSSKNRTTETKKQKSEVKDEEQSGVTYLIIRTRSAMKDQGGMVILRVPRNTGDVEELARVKKSKEKEWIVGD